VSPLIQAARRSNDGMPVDVLELVKRAIAGIRNPVIACLGLAYKANVGDTRESPALEVVRLLTKEGYEVRACDPHVPVLHGLSVPLLSLSECLTRGDCAVILTDHLPFRNLANSLLRLMNHPIVVDTRNALADRTPHDNHLTLRPLGAMH
jgi:UDP-N-acetyl-D-mannosaminuronic acid dehydrogenase